MGQRQKNAAKLNADMVWKLGVGAGRRMLEDAPLVFVVGRFEDE